MGRTSGLVQAEGSRITSAASSDLVTVYKIDSNTGQYTPRDITVTNFLSGVSPVLTPGRVVISDASTGDLTTDAQLTYSASTDTLVSTNIDLGASGLAGSVDVFPTTASRGKLTISAANSVGNTTTTITNASQSGARTYTIPDAGASADLVMTEGNQTINGTKTISDLVTSAFTATNIDAGASGTAGSLDIFPATASRGKTAFTAPNNTGNTTTTITSSAQAAARTYTIPDAGANASFVMTAGTQTIGGQKNFTSNIICTADLTVAGGLFIGDDISCSGDYTGVAINAGGDVSIGTVGTGLKIKEGLDARIGVATLSGGSVVIANTTVTANTSVFITPYDLNGSSAIGRLDVLSSDTIPGTSFRVISVTDGVAIQAGDISKFFWMLVERI